VDIEWAENKLVSANMKAKYERTFKVRTNVPVRVKGMDIVSHPDGNGYYILTINALANQTYTLIVK
jgi:hypothetical protein